ncbi:hypothetical protein WKY82_20295 [Gordonia malaquae]|uniref:phage portal protein family protein n=1 Tax=Gordonia malaquae TaxID=410332 RepID=UPI0030C7992F
MSMPLAEIGYVNGRGQDVAMFDESERIADLQWPSSVAVYDRMATDGRVASLLQAIGLPCRRTTWRLDQNGSRDEVTEFISKNLGLPIVGAEDAVVPTSRRGGARFSWAEHLATALTMLQYGHSAFEQAYRLDAETGLLWLRKLAPRPQNTISKMTVARDGGLESITQSPPAFDGRVLYAPAEVEIPISRLVMYVRDMAPGMWMGRSLLRPAYREWLLKDDIMRVQATAIRRNGAGIPVVTCAKDEPEQVKRAEEIATSMRAGNNAGIGLPPNWNAQLLGVQGNLPDTQLAIAGHDKAIALAGLAHFLNLDRGGSYALASVQADTFVQSVQTFAESIRDTANQHIVWDLVDLNWGQDEPAPLIVFDEIGSRQDATAAALKLLVDAGLLSPDVLVERKIRQDLGLPAAPPNLEDTTDVEPGAAPILQPVAARRGRRRLTTPDPAQPGLF